MLPEPEPAQLAARATQQAQKGPVGPDVVQVSLERRRDLVARRLRQEADGAARVVHVDPEAQQGVTQRAVDGLRFRHPHGRRLEVRHRLAVRLILEQSRAHLGEAGRRGGAQRCLVDGVDHRRHEGLRAVLGGPGDNGAGDLTTQPHTEPVVGQTVVQVQGRGVRILVTQARPSDDLTRGAVDDGGIPKVVLLPVAEVVGEPLSTALWGRHAGRRVGVRARVGVQPHIGVEVIGARTTQHNAVARDPDLRVGVAHGACRSGARVSQTASGAPSQQGSM